MLEAVGYVTCGESQSLVLALTIHLLWSNQRLTTRNVGCGLAHEGLESSGHEDKPSLIHF